MSDVHTTGPWRIGKAAAVVSDHPVPEIHGSDSLDYYGGHLIAESIAPQNLAIIAASPEMLDCLESLENDVGQVPDFLWKKIQQIIAKAGGRARP